MVFEGSSTAVSHTGKVRQNNQDSGYAGSNLFVVADGMGGHAGGDVASALAIQHLQELDRPFPTTKDAERALVATITETADALIQAAKARPALAGLGTTVCAISMVDDHAVIAHIGDSRIYLFRDNQLTQVTTDHSFVQRLVESGRITPDEARFHPRRSVLMRVLGDMDPNPEVDTFIMPTQPGDRWLLCSDGLSGVVEDTYTAKALRQGHTPAKTADMLLKAALDGGAPDNVTIVLVDVGGSHPVLSGTPTIVGSASNPLDVEIPAVRSARPSWLQSGKQAANEPTHYEPAAEYLEELIEEDRRRARHRRIAWITGALIVAAMIVAGVLMAYQWTQTRYFVGADDNTVVIYRGIQQNIGPITLSEPYFDSEIRLRDLTPFDRAAVERTISADSLEDAYDIVNNRLTTVGGDAE